jgi:predicted N-acetyltransferase YhbS
MQVRINRRGRRGTQSKSRERKLNYLSLIISSAFLYAGTAVIISCFQMKMEYRPISREDYEAVSRFLSEMGWQERVADPARFKTMMEKADRTVVAFENNRVVGCARALCDGVSNGYISMVAVAPDRRGRGIGRQLVRRLIGEDRTITWVLRAGRGSQGFWEKMGFQTSEIAMEKPRTSPPRHKDTKNVNRES